MESYPRPATPPDTKLEDVPPMPDHWRIDEGTRFPELEACCCLLVLGEQQRNVGRDRGLGPPSINRGGIS